MTHATDLSNGSSKPVWRVISIVGVVLVLVVSAGQSFPLEPFQSRSFLALAVLIAAVIVALRFVFRFAWETLVARVDLLIPVGVVVLGAQVLNWVTRVPVLASILMPSWSAQVLGLSLTISVSIVLQILLWTAYAAWQTDLLCRSVQGEHPLRFAPWPSLRQGFLPTLVALCLGVAVLLLGLILVMALLPVAVVVSLLAMVSLCVVWNLWTAALLPVMILEPIPLSAALATGFRRSWQLKSRWWLQLLAQLILLGMVVGFYTSRTTQIAGITTSTTTNFSYNVNAIWVGGYENQCRWYTGYMAALQAKPVPLVSELLGLLFLVLAVAMKLTVIRGLLARESPWARDPTPEHARG